MWDGVVGYDLYYYVYVFWGQGDEVLEIVMGGLCLGKVLVWFLFGGVDQVWEFYCVLDKEYWNVVVDDVLVVFFGVQFYGEIVYVVCQIFGIFVVGYCGKMYECWCVLVFFLE